MTLNRIDVKSPRPGEVVGVYLATTSIALPSSLLDTVPVVADLDAVVRADAPIPNQRFRCTIGGAAHFAIKYPTNGLPTRDTHRVEAYPIEVSP